jgi:Cu+-exporting ATPase
MDATLLLRSRTAAGAVCHHCGESCGEGVSEGDKRFCCEGCRQVYLLLSENGMCGYYDLEKGPGLRARGRFADGRYGYLDDPVVESRIIRYTDGRQTQVSFHLPSMHCVSCIWLLENLHRLMEGVLSARVDFGRKEVWVSYDPSRTSLRRIVELLAFIGYEPRISLGDAEERKPAARDRSAIHRIGVAGFCFGNIMMLSFPEYLSGGRIGEAGLREVFSWLSLALSLPVLFFSASGFFVSAWQGLRQRWLNIDAPIALAVGVAFARSVYEIASGTGSGYLDSMSGIVFLMLVGRWFQGMTHDALSFDGDYRSYLPLGVTLVTGEGLREVPVARLQRGDRIRVRHRELVPADARLISEGSRMDYSFVSGEVTPVPVDCGTLVYAGGRPMDGAVELEVVSSVSGSRITQLWNNDVFHSEKHRERSFIHPWSRYFTLGLLLVALVSAAYWSQVDAARVWPVVTSILIVACPCSLLLSATFAYGNMVRILGRNGLYLKNASVLESLGRIDTVVFDKTGTITQGRSAVLRYEGIEPSGRDLERVHALARQSAHPLSRILADDLAARSVEGSLPVAAFREEEGRGIEAMVDGVRVRLGSAHFVGACEDEGEGRHGTSVHISFDGRPAGRYLIRNEYRDGLSGLASALRRDGHALHLISGDNDRERPVLRTIFGECLRMSFRMDPQDKLERVKALQSEGRRVLMVGDGLNDAGALRQADVGISLTEDTALFSPASDAILSSSRMTDLSGMLRYAKAGRRVVAASFILSLLYNAVGLGYAVQGMLSPLVAAILMPASSISIIVFVTLATGIVARRMGLNG